MMTSLVRDISLLVVFLLLDKHKLPDVILTPSFCAHGVTNDRCKRVFFTNDNKTIRFGTLI
eukprot:3673088-Amphidinium_carterae.1